MINQADKNNNHNNRGHRNNRNHRNNRSNRGNRGPKKGLFWANLLHFYQPPDQDKNLLERIINESYNPILRIFEQLPSARATINLQPCLIELLIKNGFGSIVTRIRELLEKEQIELMLSPRFHPFMPAMPDDELDRQITQSLKICRQYFGLYYMPKGFFSPEMAYTATVAKTAARHGCRWIAVDEIAIDGSLGRIKYDKLWMDKAAGGLVLVPRDRALSEDIAGSLFSEKPIQNTNEFVSRAMNNNRYIITANDAEQFGHHQKGSQTLLRLLYRENRLNSVTVTELLSRIRKKDYCSPRMSDWSSSIDEVKRKQVFHTWNDPNNNIHKNLWELHKLAYEEIKNAALNGDNLHNRAKDVLAAASVSCGLFWASCRPWWFGVYPENMATGICQALYSLLAPAPKIKEKAYKLRQTIINQVNGMNQSGEFKKRQQKFLNSRNIDPNRFYNPKK